jgi:hypothetical protein
MSRVGCASNIRTCYPQMGAIVDHGNRSAPSTRVFLSWVGSPLAHALVIALLVLALTLTRAKLAYRRQVTDPPSP